MEMATTGMGVTPKRARLTTSSCGSSMTSLSLGSPSSGYRVFKNIKQFINALEEGTRSIVKGEIAGVFANPEYLFKRYLGCAKCSKSLKVEKDDYVCCGKICLKESNGIPQIRNDPMERKPFYLLKYFTISDESAVLENLLSYNFCIQTFMNKSAEQHGTDCDMVEEFDALIRNRQLILSVQAKCTSGLDNLTKPWELIINKIEVSAAAAIVDNPKPHDPSPDSSDMTILDISAVLAKREPFDIHVLPSIKKKTKFDDEEEYRMTSSDPRGIALHITVLENRDGGQVDIQTFETLFKKLHYEVVTLVDIKPSELPEQIKKCQNQLVKSQCDSFVLCVSCHGHANAVELHGELVNLWTSLIYKFDDTNFPEFRGRPKIVLINACQKFEEGRATANELLQNPISSPNHPDFLVFLATSPGYRSFRNPIIGTHFIRTLAYVLMRRAHDTEIKKLFYMVAKILHMPDKSAEQYPQLPEIRDFIFSKKFYFQP